MNKSITVELSSSNRRNKEIAVFLQRANSFVNEVVSEARNVKYVVIPMECIFDAVYGDGSVGIPTEFAARCWPKLFKLEVERVILGCRSRDDSLIATMLEALRKDLEAQGYRFPLYGGVALDWLSREDNGIMKIIL